MGNKYLSLAEDKLMKSDLRKIQQINQRDPIFYTEEEISIVKRQHERSCRVIDQIQKSIKALAEDKKAYRLMAEETKRMISQARVLNIAERTKPKKHYGRKLYKR